MKKQKDIHLKFFYIYVHVHIYILKKGWYQWLWYTLKMIVQQRWIRKCLQRKDIKLIMMSYLMRNQRRCRGEVSRRNTPSEKISSQVCCFHSTAICCDIWNEDDRINISVAIFTTTYLEKCYDSCKKYSSPSWLKQLSCTLLCIH